MQTYKISKTSFAALRRRAMNRVIPVVIILITAAAIAEPFMSVNKAEHFAISPVLVTLLLVFSGIGVYRGIKKLNAFGESYTLTITENIVAREQTGAPPVSVYFNDISEILKHKNGSFTIKGKEPGEIIVIPAQIDNYPQLEARLQEIHPVVLGGNIPAVQKVQSIVTYLTVGLIFCVLIIDNKIVVGICGGILVIWFATRILLTILNKNLDAATKRGTWRLFLTIGAVILIVLLKLQ